MKDNLLKKIFAGPAISLFVFFLLFTLANSKALFQTTTTMLLKPNSMKENSENNPSNNIFQGIPPSNIIVGSFNPKTDWIKRNLQNQNIVFFLIKNNRLKNQPSNINLSLKIEIKKENKVIWQDNSWQYLNSQEGVLYFIPDQREKSNYTGNYQIILN